MSISRGEVTVELEPGNWYCVVATEEYDFDFRDCTSYGPYPTADKASEVMHAHEANPGGGYEMAHAELDDYHRDLVKRARDGGGDCLASLRWYG